MITFNQPSIQFINKDMLILKVENGRLIVMINIEIDLEMKKS